MATFSELLFRSQNLDGLVGLEAQANKRDPLRNLAPAHRARIEAAMGGGKKAVAPAPKATPAKAPTKAPAPPSFAHLAGADLGAWQRLNQVTKAGPKREAPKQDDNTARVPAVITAMQARQGQRPVEDLATSNDPADRAAALILGVARRA